MGSPIVGQAVGLFVATNVDDLVVLAVFFAQARQARDGTWRVIFGQYAGFTTILAVSLVGAGSANLLPPNATPYLGLLPIVIGLRQARSGLQSQGLREPGGSNEPDTARGASSTGPSLAAVAAVTIAAGGDNVGVYVPVFALADASTVLLLCAAFFVLLGVWCAAGYVVASRPTVTRALARWDTIVLPVVLVVVGLVILVRGHAFGL